MDVLSSASSAFAVVSLAIEVGDKIKKLCDFWNSIQEAPKEVRRIARDLTIISHVLEDIREDAQSARPHARATSASLAALDQCSDSVDLLQRLLDELEPGLLSEKRRIRRWSAFKAAWKGERIRKFQEGLRDMKMTLILTRQNSSRYFI